MEELKHNSHGRSDDTRVVGAALPIALYRAFKIKCVMENISTRFALTQAVSQWVNTTWLGEPADSPASTGLGANVPSDPADQQSIQPQ